MIFTSLIDTNLDGEYLGFIDLKKDKWVPRRYVIHQGGTSSTKTWTTLQYLAIWAGKQKLVISIASESLPHIKKGVLRDFKKIISDEDFKVRIKENKTDVNFIYPNGSIVEFFGADGDSKQRGARRDVLFINECNNVPYDVFEQMDLRTGIQTILDFNPVSSFWVHEKLRPTLDMIALEKGINPLYTFRKSTYKDAVGSDGKCVLPQSTIDGIERLKYDPAKWRVYGEGEVGTLEGIIFQNFNTVPEFPKDCRWVCYGLDFGFTNDTTTLIKVGMKAGQLFFEEMIYQYGLTNMEISGKLKAAMVGGQEIICDSAEPKSVVDLRRSGWNARGASKGPDSVNN